MTTGPATSAALRSSRGCARSPSGAVHKAREAEPERGPARGPRDGWLRAQVRRVYDEHFEALGVRKVRRQLRREGVAVARCTPAPESHRGGSADAPDGAARRGAEGAGFLRSAVRYCAIQGASRLREFHFSLFSACGSTGTSMKRKVNAESTGTLFLPIHIIAAIYRGPGAGAGAGYAMNRRNRVLVTGGAGFLGSHLCERLLAEDCEVLCVDNYFTGSRDNIAAVLSNPSFEAIRHDITFPLYVEVDQIYNLACPASPIHYQFDPVQTAKVSVHARINMLGLAKRVGAPILQASTSEVYGDSKIHPQTEDYWGKRQPDRAARMLQRGQALRRDVVLRLPTPARYADQDRADIQYLRTAHVRR